MKNDRKTQFIVKRALQKGSALVYILIAVALLAALTYAISESSRGDAEQLSKERAKLLASEIIDYSSLVANGVAQLRLRGVTLAELCFDDDNWGSDDYEHPGCVFDKNRLFSPQGAGINWTLAPKDAMSTKSLPDNLWAIYADNEVVNVGTTCEEDRCVDLLLMVDELSARVCRQINDLLGVENPGGAPPFDSGYGETTYQGQFSYEQTIGDEPGGEALKGQSSACFRTTAEPSEYAYYTVLIAQ